MYNNYFRAQWMPDRTEANTNELNQDDARYGFCFFFQAEDGIRDYKVTGVQTCALPISFSARDQRLRRWSFTTTSIDSVCLVICTVLFLSSKISDRTGPGNQGAISFDRAEAAFDGLDEHLAYRLTWLEPSSL